jgi:hypothetical protein
VKTTVELPDDLVRDLKVKAAREDRKLKDLMTELLRRGLEDEPREEKPFKRVKLPLIHSKHPAKPGSLSPERIHEILVEDEVRNLVR